MEDKIKNILDDALRVFVTEKEYIDTNNGILNEHYLQYNKLRIFKDATRYIMNDVVETKQHYPVNDVSQVDIKMDFVVVKAEDFNLLADYVLETIRDSKPNIQHFKTITDE